MLKLFIAVLCSAVLAGCYQVTSAGDISAAQHVCGNVGINHISVNFVGGEVVTCQDERVIRLHQ